MMQNQDASQKWNNTHPSFLSLLEAEGENDIVKSLAEKLESTKEDVIGSSRRREIVRVRDIITYLLREYGELSYPAIGHLLGDRDHTTTLHAHKKIRSIIEKNPAFERNLSELIESVKTIKERKATIARDVIPGILAAGFESVAGRNVKTQVYKEIPERNAKILELYREGLTLQDISNVSGVTRERVRQIVISTIKQTAINESVSKGIVMDSGVLFEEASKKRQLAKDMQREALYPKKPLKEKRWSMYYAACRSCGTTAIPHVKKGLCEQCAGHFRADRREDIIAQHGDKCDSCGLSRSQVLEKHGRDFYITKDKKVLCRICFGQYTGKKLGSYKNYSWSRSHAQCKFCGTTAVPHVKNGLCENCSDTLTSVKRERIIIEHNGKCDECGLSRKSARAKYSKDLYIARNGQVLCKGCFAQLRHRVYAASRLSKKAA